VTNTTSVTAADIISPKSENSEILSSITEAFENVSEEETLKLIQDLYEAAEVYYQKTGSTLLLSDEDFDAKLDYLGSIEVSGQHEHLFEIGSRGFLLLEGDPSLGTKVSVDTVVTHQTPMLSLAKAKKAEELSAFVRKSQALGATGFRLQAKLDGLAISSRYIDGKLSTIATRGDGIHGEDVTFLLDDPNVTVKGLPRAFSTVGSVEVRGELFFTKTQFETVDDLRFDKTSERFKNSRNAATGLLKKSKGGVGFPVEFTYATYSVLIDGVAADLASIEHEGELLTVDALTKSETPDDVLTDFKTSAEVMKAVESFGKVRANLNIPTDGVVIKPTNESEMLSKMGFTSHHPVSQIAWKYPAESAKTVVLGIDMTVGKTGRVTPIARIAPVDLDGSTISNASLHNFNLIAIKDVRVGSSILIEKANDIIPQIKVVLHNPEDSIKVEVPTNCPSCDSALVGEKEGDLPPKTLKCPNGVCPSRDFFALMTAVGKNYFDIDGLSEVSLTHLNEIGRVKNIADLFTLTEEELANSTLGVTQKGTARRLGEKRAVHILGYIEKSKTRPLPKILAGLNIDLLGRTASKKLQQAFGNIDGILSATESEIGALEGFGPIGAEKIYNGLKLRAGLIATLRERGVTFGEISTTSEKNTDAEDTDSEGPSTGDVNLSGLSFAISGGVPEPFANRGAWVDFVEANGGSFHSGPKATTSFMIGDPDETSSKVKKALQLGISFMSPEEFTKEYSA
jgi:DNA ligase (NAD+)